MQKDILGLLGRKRDLRLDGNVESQLRTKRVPGTRIKHRMTKNWLKMFDKFGRILRVETVINRPRNSRLTGRAFTATTRPRKATSRWTRTRPIWFVTSRRRWPATSNTSTSWRLSMIPRPPTRNCVNFPSRKSC